MIYPCWAEYKLSTFPLFRRQWRMAAVMLSWYSSAALDDIYRQVKCTEDCHSGGVRTFKSYDFDTDEIIVGHTSDPALLSSDVLLALEDIPENPRASLVPDVIRVRLHSQDDAAALSACSRALKICLKLRRKTQGKAFVSCNDIRKIVGGNWPMM